MVSATGDYATWAAWLDRFGRGVVHDPSALPRIRGEELGGPAAARLTQRCHAALDARLTGWTQRLSRDIANAGSAQGLEIVLKDARAQLLELRRLAEAPNLFEELRSSLSETLRDAVERAQGELDRNAREGHGAERETLVRIVGGLRLTGVFDVPLQASSTTATPSTSLPDLTRPPRARRLIR